MYSRSPFYKDIGMSIDLISPEASGRKHFSSWDVRSLPWSEKVPVCPSIVGGTSGPDPRHWIERGRRSRKRTRFDTGSDPWSTTGTRATRGVGSGDEEGPARRKDVTGRSDPSFERKS